VLCCVVLCCVVLCCVVLCCVVLCRVVLCWCVVLCIVLTYPTSKILVEVGRGKLYFYQRDFEDHLLSQTKTFFKSERERLKSQYSGEEYQAKVS